MNPTLPNRETHVDALRGFALLGIVVVNSAAMASAWYGSGAHDPAFAAPVDQAVRWLIAALFETKFYLLFSFLFGYSFTLQMQSADREGVDFRPRFLRRLAGLALLGIAHALLLFQGDILLTYALLGLLLLSMRQLSARTALTIGLSLLCLTVLAWAALAALSSLAPQTLDLPALNAQARAVTEAYRGTPSEVIAQHARDIREGVAFVLLFVQAPCAFACFLFGYAAGRSGRLNQWAADPVRLRKAFIWMLAPGLLGALAYAHPGLHNGREDLALWALVIDLATAPFLSAAWALGLLWFFHSRIGAWWQARLANTGRYALTHYLSQSLIGALIYTGWGAALIGSVSPLATLLIALAIWGLQVAASGFWCRRFAYGPAEWLLRALTLWRLPAWRRPLAS